MFLTTHSVPEDDRGAVGIHGTIGIAVIFQRLPGAGDGPLLRTVHRIGHARRNWQAPLHRVPREFAHPSTNLGVSLIGSVRIWIVVECRFPAIRCDLRDAVTSALDIFPEGWNVGRVGQDGSYSND